MFFTEPQTVAAKTKPAQPKPMSYHPQPGRSGSHYQAPKPQPVYSDDDSSSLQIGKGGNKFMKKKPEPKQEEEDIEEEIKVVKPKGEPLP